MIVVLIIGILLAVAVPNFVRARERSRTRSCIANLKAIEGAKERWALENNAAPNAFVNLVPTLVPAYLKHRPVCPSGGSYNENTLSLRPQCSVG